MKTIAELNASKVPLVIIDPALNKLKSVVLFPEKWRKLSGQLPDSACRKHTVLKA